MNLLQELTYLGENYDRAAFKKVGDIQHESRASRLRLFQELRAGNISQVEFSSQIQNLNVRTFEQIERVLGKEDFLRLFGDPPEFSRSIVDAERIANEATGW